MYGFSGPPAPMCYLNSCGIPLESRVSRGARMKLYSRGILCAVPLFIIGSSFARAGDPEWLDSDEQVGTVPGSACACDAGPLSAGVPLGICVPDQTPGLQ